MLDFLFPQDIDYDLCFTCTLKAMGDQYGRAREDILVRNR